MKGKTILLAAAGLTSAAPLLVTVFLGVPLVLHFAENRDAAPSLEKALIAGALFLAVTYGTMIALMIHLYRYPQIPEKSKLPWALALFLGNILAFPVYWYLHIWRMEYPSVGRPPRRSLRVAFFSLPLALFAGILIAGGVAGARGGTLPQGAVLAWAAVFDLFFFPMLVYLLVKAARNGSIPPWKRAAWMLFLLTFNMIAFPAYAARHLHDEK